MNSFLVKKVTTNQQPLLSISWSENDGYVAIGGADGFLKVIKIDDREQQTQALLDYHKGHVVKLCWNDRFHKLTSVDSEGLIIVWMMHGSKWYEEMINNRNKSVVADMRWSPDGEKVCIVYEDGAIIMGSVEGNRLWGKEEKHAFRKMEWFPDSRSILLGTAKGEIMVYDEMGDLINQVKMLGLERLVPAENFLCPNLPLAAIEWFRESRPSAEDSPCGLCIAYSVGRLIFMRNERDDNSIAIDINMDIKLLKWSAAGSIVAVAGLATEGDEKKGVIKFYDDEGNHLKNLKLPSCDNIESLTWEATGLRLAVCYGTAFYVASVRPDYKWAYLAKDILVFAYQKMDKLGYTVVYWNTRTGEKALKQTKALLKVKGSGDFVAQFYKGVGEQASRTKVDLCNLVGTPVDSKVVGFQATIFEMSRTHVVVANQNYVYLWHYKTANSKGSLGEGVKKIGKETCWFINDKPNGAQSYNYESFNHEKETEDIVYSIAINEATLYVGRESGAILRYHLPHVTEESRLYLKMFPMLMAVNCDNSKLALCDLGGSLTLHEINFQDSKPIDLEKKDVWALLWAEDHPQQLAIMEKNKMAIVQGAAIEKHVPTEAYICQFRNLKVKGVYLDDVIKSLDGVLDSEMFMELESEFHKNFMAVLKDKGLIEATQIAESSKNKYLWEVIAKRALESLDFKEAERALLKIDDYKGTRLIRKIQQLDDKEKQRAEVMAYYGNYDQAEQLYKSMERRDLAIQLRAKIGDWFKVSHMLKEGAGYDEVLQKANDELGYYFMDRGDWKRAAEYFLVSKNYKELIEAFVKLESYDSLSQIITELPENSPQLLDLAERFKYVGLASYAAKCYERCSQPKMAVDCCVLLNHWDLAIELAEKYKLPQIETLLNQNAASLLESHCKLEAAELYRKANRNTEAAKILSGIASDMIQGDSSPLTIKKLFVMAAIEVDSYKKRMLDATMTGQGNTVKTLDSLITSDINTSSEKILNNPWRGAEAWHFFTLCQRQLYARNYKGALKTALRLVEYELELDSRKIYSLLALAAYFNKSFRECSRAFFKLEGLPIPEAERQKYQSLAADIFTRHPPKDGQAEMLPCPGKNCKAKVTEYETHCRSCGSNFQPCVLTGRSLLTRDYYTCKVCRHKMIEGEVEKVQLRHCALCHAVIDFKMLGVRD